MDFTYLGMTPLRWAIQWWFQVVLEHVDDMASSGNFERTITRFDTNFSALLVELLDKIMELSSCEHKLMNILYRLGQSSLLLKVLAHSPEGSGGAHGQLLRYYQYFLTMRRSDRGKDISID